MRPLYENEETKAKEQALGEVVCSQVAMHIAKSLYQVSCRLFSYAARSGCCLG
jgi:hypothetical protein